MGLRVEVAPATGGLTAGADEVFVGMADGWSKEAIVGVLVTGLAVGMEVSVKTGGAVLPPGVGIALGASLVSIGLGVIPSVATNVQVAGQSINRRHAHGIGMV